jgi:predicted N-acyltransferase
MRNLPLDNYSSLQELVPLKLVHWPKFYVQYSFNVHTPLIIHPQAYITLQAREASHPPTHPSCCFSINNLKRWHLDISSFKSFDDYLGNLIRWHRCTYKKSQKLFVGYGCETSFHESDWTELAEMAYRLYANVAQRFGHYLYNLNFFQEIAKRPDYKLLCAWFENRMIGVFVLQEEKSTLHSICCGFDYHHSSASCAYSWMHYVLLNHAIALQKYDHVDIGFSADIAKQSIGFNPYLSRMDIYSKGRMARGLLDLFSRFFCASLTEEQKLKFQWRLKSL